MEDQIDQDSRINNLRRLILSLVHGWQVSWSEENGRNAIRFNVEWYGATGRITTAREQLALSVLLGDPAVSEKFLLDHLMDGGLVLRTVDEVRKDERSKVAELLRQWADEAGDEGDSECAHHFLDAAELVEAW